jgi:hypothetical protein
MAIGALNLQSYSKMYVKHSQTGRGTTQSHYSSFYFATLLRHENLLD